MPTIVPLRLTCLPIQVATLLSAAVTACSAASIEQPLSPTPNDLPLTTEAPTPLVDVQDNSNAQLFARTVLPVIEESCAGCHGDNRSAPPWFGNGSNSYEKILSWNTVSGDDLVNLDAPAASILLTHGSHTGPALTAEAATQVQAWIEAESQGAPPSDDSDAVTAPVIPAEDGSATVIDLGSLGLEGARISFVLSRTAGTDVANINDLTITAGNAGLQLQAPRLIFCDTTTCTPDPANSIFIASLTLEPGQSAQLGSGGLVVLANFPAGYSLAFSFTRLAPS